MDNKKVTAYSKLSDEARQRNINYATQYNRDRAVKITIKTKKENFAKIETYMNKCINDGICNSKNSFLLEAVKYAVDNDFKGVNGD